MYQAMDENGIIFKFGDIVESDGVIFDKSQGKVINRIYTITNAFVYPDVETKKIGLPSANLRLCETTNMVPGGGPSYTGLRRGINVGLRIIKSSGGK